MIKVLDVYIEPVFEINTGLIYSLQSQIFMGCFSSSMYVFQLEVKP